MAETRSGGSSVGKPQSANPSRPDPSLAETNLTGPAESPLDQTVVNQDDQAGASGSAAGSAASGGSQPAAESASGGRKVTQLGDFKLIRRLGKGGMGEVFLAKQMSLDRNVALKTLSKELAQKPDFVQRFLREARSMARLLHPHVVQIFAADSIQGVHFVAIEYIDGRSMQDWMDDLKKLSVGDALHVTLRCAEALKHAHEENMIHRDIKPDNILVTRRGVVKVADFGLAKAVDEDVSMTQSGTGLGTPLYMAPEQARNAKHVDQRSDIYALGCTLYYFLTGQLPYTGANTLELIVAKEKGKFTNTRKLNPEVPERLDLMIDKMMAKDPAHRYADYGALIRDLAGLNLANSGLSFIAAEDRVEVSTTSSSAGRSGAATRVSPGTTAVAGRGATAPGRASAGTAAGDEPRKALWQVQHRNARGETVRTKMTAEQILRAIRAKTLDVTARARTSREGDFLPLSQFPQFADAMQGMAQQYAADRKSQGMKDIYAKLDKQDRWRKKLRWLRNLGSGAKGLAGLILWLGFVAAVIYGGWLAYPHVMEYIRGMGTGS
ncbi:MAG: serine/threonine-protein kinase [Planctomycetaceae bacterium]